MIPKVLLSWRQLYHCPYCIYFVQTPQHLVTDPTLWHIHKTTLPPSEKKEGLVALYYQVWQSASSFTRIDLRQVAIQMLIWVILLLTQKQCHEIYLNSVLSYMIQCMKRQLPHEITLDHRSYTWKELSDLQVIYRKLMFRRCGQLVWISSVLDAKNQIPVTCPRPTE